MNNHFCLQVLFLTVQILNKYTQMYILTKAGVWYIELFLDENNYLPKTKHC